MKKRILSLIMCLALVVSMMPVNTLQVHAESMIVSEESMVVSEEPMVSANSVSDNIAPEPEEICVEPIEIDELVKAATPEVPDLTANPVYVGGTALQYVGDSVAGTGGGTATLYIGSTGAPVLVLDNYVYEGEGYQYDTGCYAGIYFSGNGSMYIILGSSTSGQASENSITITAANATESYGIYKANTNYLGNLFIDGSKNDSADTLTVTGGPATNQSSGIKVTNGVKNNSKYSNNVEAYTSAEATSPTNLYMDGNFTVNAIGGTVSGEGAYSVGMDLVQGVNWNESVFDKGTFNATGGEASNGISYGIRNSVVNDATNLYFEFTGATVTATGGTAKSGSYGITGKAVDIFGGTVTAKGGNTTGGTNASTSAGISCTTLNVSGGAVNATGGDAEGYKMPYSYGINCTGDATFSGGEITAIGGKASYEGMTAYTLWAYTYGIKATSIAISEASVTATGGTCGDLVSGKDNTRESYGCCGDITMTSGSLTATGADLLLPCNINNTKKSYGIHGSINASGGTVIATGGNTVNGYCYGIYATGDCTFSGTADVTVNTNNADTDNYLYGLYLKNPATVTIADSAEVDITVATEGEYETYGIYAYTGNNKYVQTGGTVTVSAAAKGTKAYGVWIQEAEISGGTLEVSNKQTAIIMSNLTLDGGKITGTSTGVLADAIYYSPYGVCISTLTMTGGSITGTGGASTYAHSEGISITTANVSGGSITGYGGRGYSETVNVMSYGVNITGTLTFSGGIVKGTAGQASGPSEGVYISEAILSNNAQIVGQGGISDRANSVGISISDASVSDTVTMTGNGGQASGPSVGVYIAKADLNNNAQINGQGGTSIDNSIGVSFGTSITMGAESEAQVTGNGGNGNLSMGIKFGGSTFSLEGGTLTATGGTTYTTASYGLYTEYTFALDGTLLTAKGNTSAVGCDSKEEISSEAIVVSTDIAGTSTSPLSYGGHAISTLTEYKYLKAGTIEQIGATPTKRDISGATITLASSSLTYNGLEQTMEVTSVKLGSVELLDDVIITGNTATNAGTYTLTVTAKAESLYTGSVTKEFTVDRLKITPVVTVTGGPYAYKSTVDQSAVIVKYGDVVLELDVDYTVEIHTTTVGENGGIVYVYPTNSGSNYTFNRVDAHFTVVKAENPVVVTTPVTVIRGGNQVNLDYSNNQAGKPDYSFDGDALGCTITNGTLTSGETAGTVTVKATFPADGKYNEAVRTITVNITDKNEAELSWVTLADADYKYNDETKLAQVYHSGSGSRVKEDIIEYSGTTRSGATYTRSTTPPTQAGNYTVHVTYETKDTIYTGSDDFVIRPKDISSLITVELGDALTYNGEEQTQTVTEVRDANADYTFTETEYDIAGNKQTNAGNYSLDITGKGNFTGSKTVSYTIAKETPTLEDFIIPDYDDTVDYTGVAVELPLPTTNKIGMGDTYIETYVRDAGTYEVTFRVSAGDNYTAATGLVYGTLTVNQVYRPTTVTNAEVILGGNTINLDSYVSTEGYPAKTYEIVGEGHGCSISNGVFTSGSETCTVTVQITLEGNKNYKETVKTFTVTVKDKNTASLTVTQPDVEYNYGKDIGMLSPTFTGQAGTKVSQSMVYVGTLWNDEVYASSETKPTQAGEYTVHVTYETKDTIYTGSTTFKINPRQIGGTITLGDALTYTGEPQTQTVTKVTDGDYTYTAADYDISGNVQTNAGQYILTLSGKGNFTGTMEKYYTIAKATPQLSDFNIPELTAVDYTGEYITVAPPTTTKNGMGEVYLTGADGIINAKDYVITFGVHDGQNYKAASGFEYGTLTVNKVAHPMTVTNAVVGINGRQINLSTRVTTEFGYSVTFEFVTPEEERLGCQINGATFTSGTEAGTVTVQATVYEGTNYLETSKTFTVEVVEVGGVEIWGYVKSSGSSSDETIIQLLQDGEVKHETVKYGNTPMYTFDGVAAGTHILRVSKKDHVTYEKEITVASEDLREDVELVYEIDSVTATCDNFPESLTAEETLPVPDSGFIYTTDPGETVLDANGVWQKKNGEEWEDVSGEIEAGATYRYKTTLKMDGENTTCTLADSVTLKVNDTSWTVDYGTMQNSKKTDAYVTVYSPEIVGTCIVSFAAGGGTGTMAAVTGVFGEYTLPECGFTAPDEMRFKAWSVDGVEKAAGETVDIITHTVVTAVWEEIPHVHVFDREVATDDYKATEASCIAKATYYMSCECGEKGTETFEYGEFVAHTEGTEWLTDEENHWHVCTVAGCGVVIEESKAEHTPDHEGGATEEYAVKCTVCLYEMEAQLSHTHIYDQEVATDDYKATEASCIEKATYYKSCVCGEKGTETFEYGELADHTPDRECPTPKDAVKCSVCEIELAPALYKIEEIPDLIYTGKAQKPKVKVYHEDVLLKEGKDYTLTYANNKNANAMGDGGVRMTKVNDGVFSSMSDEGFNPDLPYVIIKGKANYQDDAYVNFNITAPVIGDGSAQEAEDVVLKYTDHTEANGKLFKPFTSIKYGKISMKSGVDYEVTVAKAGEPSTNLLDSKGKMEAVEGTYIMTIKALGNFAGEIVKTISVAAKPQLLKNAKIKLNVKSKEFDYLDPEADNTTLNDGDYTVTIKDGKVTKELKKDTDFTVSYRNNDRLGTATLVLTGTGSYVGIKTITFKINGTKLTTKNVEITNVSDSTYTGKNIEQDAKLVLKKADGSKVDLIHGSDYTVTYKNNLKKGTATITFTGSGLAGYTGSVKKTFKIGAANLTDDMVAAIGTVPYVKTGATADAQIVLTYNGITLVKGKDYTLKYTNNKDLGEANVTITGKGNFTGMLPKTFEVVKQDISNTTITIKPLTYKPKEGYVYKLSVTVKNGKSTMKKGADYVVEFTNPSKTDLELWFAGDDAKAPKASIKAVEGSCYTGSVEVPVNIFNLKLSSSNAYVRVDDSTNVYNGAQQLPKVAVYYSADKAVIKELNAAEKAGKVDAAIDEKLATGKIIELRAGTDYMVSGGANIFAGPNKGVVKITGTGTYSGSVSKKFTIQKKNIWWNE